MGTFKNLRSQNLATQERSRHPVNVQRRVARAATVRLVLNKKMKSRVGKPSSF